MFARIGGIKYMNKRRVFARPVIKIIGTVILVLLIAFFYRFAVSNYNNSIINGLETLDTSPLKRVEEAPKTLDEALEALGTPKSAVIIDSAFVEYCGGLRDGVYDDIVNYLSENEYSDDMWKEICGQSVFALYDLSGADGDTDTEKEIIKETGDRLSLVFAGDVSLDSVWDWSPINVFADKRSTLLESAFSVEIAEKMIGSDMFCVSLESPITATKDRLKGQNYAHAAKPEDAEVLGLLGIDIVNIANNRIYDCAAAGFSDTLNALGKSGVAYIGGGKNSADATSPCYVIAGGRKVAYIAASREKTRLSAPEASGTNAGIVYMINSASVTNSISEARDNADYVIVYADFGNNNDTEKNKALAHSFIDAGADIVIGCGADGMKPIEYYAEKPIIYNLGMFWYETDRHEAIMVELEFRSSAIDYEASDAETETSSETPDSTEKSKFRPAFEYSDAPSIYIIPCIQDGAATRLATGDDRTSVLGKITASSENVAIGENGLLTKAE